MHVDAGPAMRWVQAVFRFETSVASVSGVARLVQEDPGGPWKAWTVLTSVDQLLDYPERRTTWTDARRPEFVKAQANKRSWRELTDERRLFQDRDPVVLVIEAGQAGLNMAARLHRLGVETLVVRRISGLGTTGGIATGV